MFNVKFVYIFYLIFFQVNINLFIHEAYSSFITSYILFWRYNRCGTRFISPTKLLFCKRRPVPEVLFLLSVPWLPDRTEEEIHPQEFGEVSSLSCWQFDRRRCSPRR